MGTEKKGDFTYREINNNGKIIYLVELSMSWDAPENTFQSIKQTIKNLSSVSTNDCIFVSAEALKTLI